MVVRKWNVPSFCPKPDPGVVAMPVSFSISRQYITSGARPLLLAATTAPSGSATLGKAYREPAATQVMPGSELKALVMAAARRSRLRSTSRRSDTHKSNDGSPDTGGLTMTPMATCPGTLGLRLMDESLYISATTSSGTFMSSTIPPRRPHSPKAPLDTVWKVRIWVSAKSRPPALATTDRALMNGRAPAYTLSWYTSSQSRASSSLWQMVAMPKIWGSVSCCPVGLPGLMNTRPRGQMPSRRARSTAA
mmetsp:Transcript_19763/g.44808  ORF Transcript_19763/g.44808 Transcript_19763/m.44808 type:complete len:249 (+) Transcript_19763:231-977(+)